MPTRLFGPTRLLGTLELIYIYFVYTSCMFYVIFNLIDFIEQYGSLPPPPPASVLEDPLVTGASREQLIPLGVFMFELTLFSLFLSYKIIKEIQ